VGSWPITTHSTPSTTPTPVSTLAPTVNPVPQAASGDSFQERAVRVEQQRQPLADTEPAALAVPLHVALAPARDGALELLVEPRQELQLGRAVARVLPARRRRAAT
jgi:hypothetical protein